MPPCIGLHEYVGNLAHLSAGRQTGAPNRSGDINYLVINTIMAIPVYDQDRVKKVCRHEIGHSFVAKTLLFKTNGVRVRFQPGNGHIGQAEIEPWTPYLTDLNHVKTYLERRVQVLYAGVIAESMDRDGNYNGAYAVNEWERGGAINDHAKIRELVQVLRNIVHPETTDTCGIQSQLTALNTELVEKSATIIHEHIELIYSIGDFLFTRIQNYNEYYTLTDQEIDDLISGVMGME
jgi:hypothetical protein